MKKQVIAAKGLQQLTAQEKGLMKQEQKKISQIKTKTQAAHYAHNVFGMKNGRKRTIILMALTTPEILLAKLAMPKPELEYQDHSVNMQAAMVADVKHFFSLPFSPVFLRLAQWAAENTEYLAGINDVKNKVTGGKGRRKAAKTALRITLKMVLDYVNGIILLHQDRAQEIAEAVLMTLVSKGSINKQEISVKQGKAAGEIKVNTLSPKNEKGNRIAATYERQYSSDKGITWTSMQTNARANDTATGLQSGVSYIFRKRYTTAKGGTTQWIESSPITPN